MRWPDPSGRRGNKAGVPCSLLVMKKKGVLRVALSCRGQDAEIDY